MPLLFYRCLEELFCEESSPSLFIAPLHSRPTSWFSKSLQFRSNQSVSKKIRRLHVVYRANCRLYSVDPTPESEERFFELLAMKFGSIFEESFSPSLLLSLLQIRWSASNKHIVRLGWLFDWLGDRRIATGFSSSLPWSFNRSFWNRSSETEVLIANRTLPIWFIGDLSVKFFRTWALQAAG